MDAEFDRLLAGLGSADDERASLRDAAWCIFDIAAAEPDLNRATQLAEQMCAELANARGAHVSVRVYRQRGRDMIRFRAQIAAMSRDATPLTYAKHLRDASATKGHVVDLDLINAVLIANRPTQEAILELVESGRLRLIP